MTHDPHSSKPPENAAPQKTARLSSLWNGTKRRARTIKTYAVEIFNEHDLWVEALAVKGGASALVAAGIVGLSYVVALPFMLAAMTVAGCGALIGLGVYGVAAGGARAWDSLRSTIARIRGVEPPAHLAGQKRNIFQRLQETAPMVKLRGSAPAKRLMSTRAWKVTEKFMRKREEGILGSLALGGALATLGLGTALLVTQVLVLPIVAIGVTATFVAVEALTMIASGAYGLHLCYDHFKKRKTDGTGKTEKEETPAVPAPPAPEPAPAVSTQNPLAPAFTRTAQAAPEKEATPAPAAAPQPPHLKK